MLLTMWPSPTRVVISGTIVVMSLLLVCASLALETPWMLHPIDFLALQSIRKSLEDMPGSHFFSSWDFTADPCSSFSGVFCNDGRVTALSLGDLRAGSPGLIGRLDAAVGRLSGLAELSVVPGHVYGTIPDTVSCLRNLRFLALSRNYFSGQIPQSIGSLRRLQTLDLSYNQLSGEIPLSIPPSVVNLVLCHNHLTGRIPNTLTSVVRLDLKHNDLSGEISTVPPSLQYLSLSSNRLSGRIDRFIFKLVRLNFVDLSMNRFSGPIPAVLFSFRISSLQLQRNAFSGELRTPSHVAGGMMTVDLSYNRLEGEIPAAMAEVRNLYLNNNRLKGRVPRGFVEKLMSGGIRILYLQHNYLTGIEMERAAEIPVSSSLCLQYNCMVPPVRSQCPFKAGNLTTRPVAQCR